MTLMVIAGILTPLENLLTSVLEWLHTSVGFSWAWSIVALTVIVRMLLVPLTVRQIHSMQNLQAHAPEMKAIQQRWKHDKKRQNEELMKFYRDNKINPAASCLPIVAQIPVFISLFFVLKDFEREIFPQYPDSGLDWLGLVNITEPTKDGWGPLLLVVYVASQLSSSWLMSGQMQKAQRVLLMVLPIVFIPFILKFPSGLMIYWLTTNLWTTGQGIVTRRLIPRPLAPEKRSSRTLAQEPEPEPEQPPPRSAKKRASSGDARDGKPVVARPPRRVKRKKGGSGGRRR
jgi:YidC/Oxa1 family membrane protein insertase